MVTRENGTVGGDGVVLVVVVDVVDVVVVVVVVVLDADVDSVVGLDAVVNAVVLLGLLLTLQNGTWPSQ